MDRIEELEARIATLERQLSVGSGESRAQMAAETTSLRSALCALPSRARQSRVSHRATFAMLLVMLIAGAAFGHFADSPGEVLRQFMDFSTPHVTPPPLDTMVRWQRRDRENALLGQTNQIVSLIADASQQNSHTWPLYIQLAGTTNPNATLNSSQSVGSTVRGFNRSTGSPWMAGHHSEIYHGFTALDGQQVETQGTSILFNGEFTVRSAHGAAIGLNLQNTPLSTSPALHAINIQSTSATANWQNGIHFEGSGTAGNTGINFDAAQYTLGINLADNSLRLNAGQKVMLDSTGNTYLWYNPAVAKVQVVRSSVVVATW
jgi:hypothetical protein